MSYLLEALSQTNVVRTLRTLSVKCFTHEGVNSLLTFVTNSNVSTLRYERGSCVRFGTEYLLWVMLSTSSNCVLWVQALNQSTVETIIMVVNSLSVEQRNKMTWRKLSKMSIDQNGRWQERSVPEFFEILQTLTCENQMQCSE